MSVVCGAADVMTAGSLFAGIGGFDLGLERAGFEISWQVEIDRYARRVLAKHWPDVPRHWRVQDVGAANLDRVDLICGGFPCQDISSAGTRAGIEGARSGLWSEFARIIGELRPRWVIIENVSRLVRAGLDRVLWDLASIGYDAEWDHIEARDLGAPHRRSRIWIVAYPNSGRQSPQRPTHYDHGSDAQWDHVGRCRARILGQAPDPRAPWPVEPDICRVAHGVPSRVDRLRGLGNAIVPSIARWIGQRIIEQEAIAYVHHESCDMGFDCSCGAPEHVILWEADQ